MKEKISLNPILVKARFVIIMLISILSMSPKTFAYVDHSAADAPLMPGMKIVAGIDKDEFFILDKDEALPHSRTQQAGHEARTSTIINQQRPKNPRPQFAQPRNKKNKPAQIKTAIHKLSEKQANENFAQHVKTVLNHHLKTPSIKKYVHSKKTSASLHGKKPSVRKRMSGRKHISLQRNSIVSSHLSNRKSLNQTVMKKSENRNPVKKMIKRKQIKTARINHQPHRKLSKRNKPIITYATLLREMKQKTGLAKNSTLNRDRRFTLNHPVHYSKNNKKLRRHKNPKRYFIAGLTRNKTSRFSKGKLGKLPNHIKIAKHHKAQFIKHSTA